MKSAAILLIMTLLIPFLYVGESLAENLEAGNNKVGAVRVSVSDAVTNAPLIGASVMIPNTKIGASTDALGRASINNVSVGGYSLIIHLIGYRPLALTDVMIRPERTTFVDALLTPSAIEAAAVVVSGGYFGSQSSQPTSSIGYNAEEIRRSPGTAGDVSRILNILPGVSKVNDQMNNLVVRGGTPSENGFYIDNIEIPNINHYPVQGATGGPIGLINTDFIQEVNFSAGGFGPSYGDKLSAIMEMKFREGNRDEFDGQLDMHMAGIGAAVEGPFAGKKGSYLASARRSYLDFLVDAIGTGVAPKYSDYQAKVVYDLSTRDKLSFLGLGGVDYIKFGKQRAIDEGDSEYGVYRGLEYASGINWRHIWKRSGYSNTSVSILGTRLDQEFFDTDDDSVMVDNTTYERALQVRNVNTWQIGKTDYLEFGFDSKYFFSNYDYHYGSTTNALGDPVPALIVSQEANSPKFGLHAAITLNPFAPLTTTFGLRYDYFDFNERSHVSPRFSFALRLSDRTTLSGATGIYHENLPLSILVQKDANKELKDVSAEHFILGIGYLLTENTKLTLEGYLKNCRNYPIDPAQPQFFAADVVSYYGFFGNYDELLDAGKSRSYGVEAILQKKLVSGFYGLASLSYSISEYKTIDNTWRNRMFDNRLIMGIEGGFKPNNRWEFSSRWIFAGGVPYTPLDLAASRELNRTVYDDARVNDARYPAYHSMNVRLDKRFMFTKSNLILYFSIWNVYNRKNISTYHWDENERQQETLYQWSLLPVGGIEFEF